MNKKIIDYFLKLAYSFNLENINIKNENNRKKITTKNAPDYVIIEFELIKKYKIKSENKTEYEIFLIESDELSEGRVNYAYVLYENKQFLIKHNIDADVFDFIYNNYNYYEFVDSVKENNTIDIIEEVIKEMDKLTNKRIDRLFSKNKINKTFYYLNELKDYINN